MSQFIEVYENVLSRRLCRRIIKMHSKGDSQPGRTGAGVNPQHKDSLDVMMGQPEWQPYLQEVLSVTNDCMREYLQKHPAALVSGITPILKHPQTQRPTAITIENFNEIGVQMIDPLINYIFCYSGFIVQHYKQNQGGYHYWHSEIFPKGQHNEPLHRVLALLYYLNDVEDGGETGFFYQQCKIKPKRGSVIIFPAGFTHTHKGYVPRSSDKYIIASWLMFNRAEQLFPSTK